MKNLKFIATSFSPNEITEINLNVFPQKGEKYS